MGYLYLCIVSIFLNLTTDTDVFSDEQSTPTQQELLPLKIAGCRSYVSFPVALSVIEFLWRVVVVRFREQNGCVNKHYTCSFMYL